MTTSTRMLAGLVLGAALGLGGCADGDGVDDPAASSAPSATAPSASPSATPSASASSPGGGAARGIPRTTTVRVTAVDGGCTYVLDDGSGDTLALRGDLPTPVAVGDLLTLSGAPDDTPYDDCPDGRPFLVSTLEPAG